MASNSAFPIVATPFGRRQFLWSAAAGVAVLGAGSTLAGCAKEATAESRRRRVLVQPKRGGTLQLGATGRCEHRHPRRAEPAHQRRLRPFGTALRPAGEARRQGAAHARLGQVHHSEQRRDGMDHHHPGRHHDPSGQTVHRGRRALQPQPDLSPTSSPARSAWAPSTSPGSKVVNPTTLLVKFSKPYGVFVDFLSLVQITMVPRDFDPAHPDGTGPFKFESFTPGVASKFVRNENYWQKSAALSRRGRHDQHRRRNQPR